MGEKKKGKKEIMPNHQSRTNTPLQTEKICSMHRFQEDEEEAVIGIHFLLL
jgi:hypothetical protein